jgi:hypothetical protein
MRIGTSNDLFHSKYGFTQPLHFDNKQRAYRTWHGMFIRWYYIHLTYSSA